MIDKENLDRFCTWLSTQGAVVAPCQVAGFERPKTGFSAETLMITVTDGAGVSREIIVRIDRPGKALFLDASIERQARMMQGLVAHGAPVPAVLGWTDDISILGAPFLVMERAPGISLPQHPSYHVAGPLIDHDHAARDRAWRSCLTTIAQINRMDWRSDFAFLHDPSYGEAGLDHYLGWVRAWRDSVLDEHHPIIDPALDRLEANRPSDMPAELLWGDSNPGNFLFGPDGAVTAALDFEAAAIGPAEIDLAWWFVLDDMLAAGNSLPEGMPDKAAQIAIYEAELGRPVRDLAYFELLGAVRMSLVMAASVRVGIRSGVLPPENRANIVNPVSLMLAEMIDIDMADDLGDYMQMVTLMNER